MNCPSCNRPLAAGARQCVYCGRGTGARLNPNVIDRSVPRPQPLPRKGGRLGWILLILVVLGAAAFFAVPELREKVRPLLESLRRLF